MQIVLTSRFWSQVHSGEDNHEEGSRAREFLLHLRRQSERVLLRGRGECLRGLSSGRSTPQGRLVWGQCYAGRIILS